MDLKKETVTEIRKTIGSWYGIQLTDEQVVAIVASEEGYAENIEEMGFDTVERENFLQAMTSWLGLEGGWPIGLDTESYTQAFFLSFRQAAEAKGLKLDDEWGL